MSMMEELDAEAEEEKVFQRMLKEEGVTAEEYYKRKEIEEMIDELRAKRAGILKRASKAKAQMQELYNELADYNTALDGYGPSIYEPTNFWDDIRKKILDIDIYFRWLTEESEALKNIIEDYQKNACQK